jgi:hypothetical protein
MDRVKERDEQGQHELQEARSKEPIVTAHDLCICQAHDFSAGRSNVLAVRLDSGVTSSLLTWQDMCDATCVSVN